MCNDSWKMSMLGKISPKIVSNLSFISCYVISYVIGKFLYWIGWTLCLKIQLRYEFRESYILSAHYAMQRRLP